MDVVSCSSCGTGVEDETVGTSAQHPTTELRPMSYELRHYFFFHFEFRDRNSMSYQDWPSTPCSLLLSNRDGWFSESYTLHFSKDVTIMLSEEIKSQKTDNTFEKYLK